MNRIWLLLALAVVPGLSQDSLNIHVDASQKLGPMRQNWGFFGYDEANYTYTCIGKKLISELSALAPQPVYIRTHFLLATGDGKPALKWGSSNAYTEDAEGKPVYDWSVIDRIFDTYLNAGAKPFVEISRAGLTRRETTTNGANLYIAGLSTAFRNTVHDRLPPGTGRSGMSLILPIGTARRKNTTSSTTTR
jgi:hypothetical protein